MLITMMEKMLRSDDDLSGIYHYSGTPYVSWFQFAEEIFSNIVSQIGSDKKVVVNPIPTHEYPTPAKRPPDTRLDCRKIEKVFSITPSLWQNALKNMKAFQE